MSEPKSKKEECDSLIGQLLDLGDDLVRCDSDAASLLVEIHPTYGENGQNLIHYLGLRRHDLRPVQMQLAALGLSSLGRAESHVLGNLDAVLRLLHQVTERSWQPPPETASQLDFETGQELLAKHAAPLLGPPPAEREVRIMVTMPSEAADNYTLVQDLLRHGMDCMRINCAHDDAAHWSQMVAHLRRGEQATQRSCRILMDIAGPKLRTGPLDPGPAVVKIRPKRDKLGRVTRRARVWLFAEEMPHSAPASADARLPLPQAWVSRLQVGDKIKFTDARAARRTWRVVDITNEGCWAEAEKTAYLTSGMTVRCRFKQNG